MKPLVCLGLLCVLTYAFAEPQELNLCLFGDDSGEISSRFSGFEQLDSRDITETEEFSEWEKSIICKAYGQVIFSYDRDATWEEVIEDTKRNTTYAFEIWKETTSGKTYYYVWGDPGDNEYGGFFDAETGDHLATVTDSWIRSCSKTFTAFDQLPFQLPDFQYSTHAPSPEVF